MAIRAQLRQVIEEQGTLTLDEAQVLMRGVLAGETSEMELAALLGAMAARGETAGEIAGFALALRAASVTLPLSEAERDELVDTCGTGGDGADTINISTAAALVAAAAGAKVAKHGNRAVTSRCGSADVLEALGVPIGLTPDEAAAALRAHGFCFLLAPAHHPGLRAVLPVRRALGVRTIFNLLGPLLNPAGARRQVMGVYSGRVVRTVAEAMPLLGVERALVVHGAGGLDEFSLAGPNQVAAVGAIETAQMQATYLGLAPARVAALAGGASAQENAELLRTIFRGERGPRRDVVVLNAAAVLMVAACAPDMRAAVALAAETLDSGAVVRLLAALGR